MKQPNLSFQQIKKLREIGVLRLQLVNVVGHDGHLKQSDSK
jgi:hypothetical protein